MAPARRAFALGWSAGLALALPAGLAAQGYGFLVGTVLDDVTGEPLAGAAVSILGSQVEARTDAEGRFLLEGLPIAQVNLKVALDAYTSVVESIDVSATEVGFLQVRLRPVVMILDDLRVIARRRDEPEAPEVRDPQDVWKSVLDLLEDEIPGLQVRRVGGQVSGGASIRIRGTGSFRNNDPAIYLDGVRISDPASGFQAPRMLDQIPAETVARIRVLRGPTAQYPYAANGVIVIETVRGGASR